MFCLLRNPSVSQPRSGSRATIPGLGTLGVSSYQGVESRGTSPLRRGWAGKCGTTKWHFSTNVNWMDGNGTTFKKCQRFCECMPIMLLRDYFQLNTSPHLFDGWIERKTIVKRPTDPSMPLSHYYLRSYLHQKGFLQEEMNVKPLTSSKGGGEVGGTLTSSGENVSWFYCRS